MTAQLHARDIALALGARHILEGVDLSVDPGQRIGLVGPNGVGNSTLLQLMAGQLSAEQAAAAKFWTTELQNKVVDRCLQLHGGYGYMLEYPIARAWADSRIQTIYGGTSEIMREIVGRAITGG